MPAPGAVQSSPGAFFSESAARLGGRAGAWQVAVRRNHRRRNASALDVLLTERAALGAGRATHTPAASNSVKHRLKQRISTSMVSSRTP